MTGAGGLIEWKGTPRALAVFAWGSDRAQIGLSLEFHPRPDPMSFF